MLELAFALPLLFSSPNTVMPIPRTSEKLVIAITVNACTDEKSGVSGRCLILTGERGEIVFFFDGQLRSIKLRFDMQTLTIWERKNQKAYKARS